MTKEGILVLAQVESMFLPSELEDVLLPAVEDALLLFEEGVLLLSKNDVLLLAEMKDILVGGHPPPGICFRRALSSWSRRGASSKPRRTPPPPEAVNILLYCGHSCG